MPVLSVEAPACVSLTVLLQHGADPNIRNTDGKSALDLADPSAKAVLTGECFFLLAKYNGVWAKLVRI